ncbi:CHAP domain-containing protein [Actinomadura craniellae]|uniref:CHAP domain-containing protein n=1 Tax=Actinomadura craniellae TaxID=2231787 RepID=A0A365H275_9ACTN|nr:CHAP domain-containing protein [Actinomadura craniellae]RAY13126.1 CHAP domain-containing protein [Actinomadura craniellae]
MSGKHRKTSLREALALRAVGGVVLGATAVGTVAATAQATAPIIDQSRSGVVAQDRGHAPKDGSRGNATQRKAVKAASVISLAKTQVGVSEDHQGESKFGKWYAETPRAKQTTQRDGGDSTSSYDRAAWCSMFITWLGSKTGFTYQMGADAWTVKHAEWFKDQGRWGTKPKPGAVVFYDWAGGKRISGIDHVGLVVKPLGQGKIETVEGNVGNSVMSKVRSTADVVGYGYPDYAR